MKVLIYNEGVHEKENPEIFDTYPGGIHGYLKSFIETEDITVETVTLETIDKINDSLLEETDVLIWWGHKAHNDVKDETVELIHKHILKGMGLVALHSAHHSKIFKKLMGTTCNLKWRHDARERLWVINPYHPIAKDVPETILLEEEEMYGEMFDIPQPDEVIFLGWFNSGEVFRSGCTWQRGYGKIFYFQPGHETFSAFTKPEIQTIIKNAVNWACPIRNKKEIICENFKGLE
ncbi:MAG: trehalose utilization protein ThuA [Ruminococcaceae bacterium]|nr:trehalose utilization protein ThuA [Oscillospiraceae bacterium]